MITEFYDDGHGHISPYIVDGAIVYGDHNHYDTMLIISPLSNIVLNDILDYCIEYGRTCYIEVEKSGTINISSKFISIAIQENDIHLMMFDISNPSDGYFTLDCEKSMKLIDYDKSQFVQMIYKHL